MKTWSLLPTLSASMPFQMALDELLFRGETLSTPLLRFYFSSEPWISVGYSSREKTNGKIPVCRRITGGGRVLHGKDLIFSIVAHKEHDESFKSVRISYLKIHEAVKLGLESLGKEPRFYRCDEELPRGEDCFLFPIATDLALGSTKIAGGSQKRSAGVLLHQESLQIPKGIEAMDMAKAICQGFEKTFEAKLDKITLRPELLKQAEQKAKGV